MLSNASKMTLAQMLQRWPEAAKRFGGSAQPARTVRLEKWADRLVVSGWSDIGEVCDFLDCVRCWKGIRASIKHDEDLVQQVFCKLCGGALPDRARIEECTRLSGFGTTTGSARAASAILRFLWPDEYGTVDWRNWAVLCLKLGNEVELTPLAADAQGYKELPPGAIDVDRYLEYLEVLRQIRDQVDFTSRVADIDLALWTWSRTHWPKGSLSKRKRTTVGSPRRRR